MAAHNRFIRSDLHTQSPEQSYGTTSDRPNCTDQDFTGTAEPRLSLKRLDDERDFAAHPVSGAVIDTPVHVSHERMQSSRVAVTRPWGLNSDVNFHGMSLELSVVTSKGCRGGITERSALPPTARVSHANQERRTRAGRPRPSPANGDAPFCV
jgi:hypothetical protein